MRAAFLSLCAATAVAAFATQVTGNTSGCAASGVPPETLLESGYAPVNGLRMYYEVHGRRGGVPLVLLHGGGSTIESTFGRILPCLARHRQVIAVEEQGHGRTSDRNDPFRFESSADDVATLLEQLESKKRTFSASAMAPALPSRSRFGTPSACESSFSPPQ